MATFSVAPFTNNGNPVLPPRHFMVPGQYLESPSKRFKLLLQPDINLALYDNGALAWVADNNPYTTTSRNPNNDLVNCFYVHTTGILVDHSRGRAWMTTNGVPVGGDKGSAERTFVQVQDDGNLVIVESVPFWASNAALLPDFTQPSLAIPGGTTLEVDKRYVVGGTTMVFQSDGNFVVSNGPLGVLWASWTQNKGATRAVMQTDGNFVIYGANNTPLWYTGTAGQPGAELKLQANGRLSVVKELPVWARFGYTPTVRPRRRVIYPGSTIENWKVKDFTFDNVWG
ncbi:MULTISPECIES: putidacin L1 family lectin-like bacteriocin [unclassified Pseudomonas]|uniref:putidacin L1 family lectin-like bacteriocin n=1 Tax=unclassified Pseudomonas TaxID=196821 RepID=UPI00083909E9|nr:MULTISPECIES: putidacin L1 family lectin-like bacteriocin [unclassified Pseudomonas]